MFIRVRRKAEEDRVHKEEEKAYRELIKQEYLRRKQQELLEEQGVTKPCPKSLRCTESSYLDLESIMFGFYTAFDFELLIFLSPAVFVLVPLDLLSHWPLLLGDRVASGGVSRNRTTCGPLFWTYTDSFMQKCALLATQFSFYILVF